MPDVDLMGIENASQGICGFTSTLYAVYMNQSQLQARLTGAMGGATRSTRLMAEIKTFLQMMKAAGRQEILNGIEELTRTFPRYGTWTVDTYIAGINTLNLGNYSIAMPPEAVKEYLRVAWNIVANIDNADTGNKNAILGLSRTGAPMNKWKNLAHYVYRDMAGRIYSWGEQFTDLAKMNTAKNRNYSVIYTISLCN